MAINQKLLVVEDNTFMRALISDLLVSLGFEVEAVESASAAVKAAARFDPDAAILDVELGAGPNGFDLARILRESAPEIGLVFLTNIPEPKTIGVDNRSIPKDAAYLVKDSVGDIDLLLKAIKASMRGRVGQELRHDRDVHSLSNLSRSQLDLLHLAALGLSNTEIAARRGTTVRAVENLFKRAIDSAGIEVGPGEHGRVLAVRKYIETVVLPKS
ncbi:MAG: response regulator [Rhodoluna sp.]|nr:response regulator [Rhodoluna sp.]